MRKIIYFVVFAVLHSVSQAQGTGPVLKGKVTDLNGIVLAGASITIENTILGDA